MSLIQRLIKGENLEAVDGLLAVPDGGRQRELAAQPVLVDGAQRPAAHLLSLGVMARVPQLQRHTHRHALI